MWNNYASSKICRERNIDRNQRLHMRKLQKMKSYMTISNPLPCPHLDLRAKQKLKKKQQNNQILTENTILLRKMLSIDLHKTPMARQQSRQRLTRHRSLNSLNRSLEQSKICRENSVIHKTLKMTRSMYSHAKWEQSHVRNKYYANQISANARRAAPPFRPFSSYASRK